MLYSHNLWAMFHCNTYKVRRSKKNNNPDTNLAVLQSWLTLSWPSQSHSPIGHSSGPPSQAHSAIISLYFRTIHFFVSYRCWIFLDNSLVLTWYPSSYLHFLGQPVTCYLLHKLYHNLHRNQPQRFQTCSKNPENNLFGRFYERVYRMARKIISLV